MICDNCGQETKRTQEAEYIETRYRLAWPPVERVIVQEMWCMRCKYGGSPVSSSVDPTYRNRLEIEDRK
jgi:hypothetical protein